jgi:preprotein translocase subunit YajC
MWTDAFAQTAAPGAPANPAIPMLLQVLQFLPIIAIFYLLLIRPQQQKQKKLDQMLKELKKGDRVVTAGGIIGTVIGVDEAKAVLKIADDVKVEFTKASITQVLGEANS